MCSSWEFLGPTPVAADPPQIAQMGLWPPPERVSPPVLLSLSFCFPSRKVSWVHISHAHSRCPLDFFNTLNCVVSQTMTPFTFLLQDITTSKARWTLSSLRKYLTWVWWFQRGSYYKLDRQLPESRAFVLVPCCTPCASHVLGTR